MGIISIEKQQTSPTSHSSTMLVTARTSLLLALVALHVLAALAKEKDEGKQTIQEVEVSLY